MAIDWDAAFEDTSPFPYTISHQQLIPTGIDNSESTPSRLPPRKRRSVAEPLHPAKRRAFSSDDDSDESPLPTPIYHAKTVHRSASWAHQKDLKQRSTADHFSPNVSRLQNFQNKVLQDDNHAEFDVSNPRRVRCSSCSKWVKMRVLYELRRWSEHRNSGACRKHQHSALRTSSLASYFGQTRTTHATNHVHIPCPGLTVQSDPRIGTYLQRSTCAGGGASSRPALAAGLFSGRKWVDLDTEEKRVVLRREESEFVWRNSRATGAVYASDCKRLAGVASTISKPNPCTACASVQRLRLFQTRIQVPMPADEHMQFVPKAYQCPELGTIYLKYKGVRELVETVCRSLDLWYLLANIHSTLG